MKGVLLLAAVALSGCVPESRVVVGSKNFTEQIILGELIAQLLEHRGVHVDRRLNLGGTFICHRALVSGDLDVYVEYTGTALNAILKEPVLHDADVVYRSVRDAYRERFGLEWSKPLGFANTFAMSMRKEQATALGVRTLSDLGEHARSLRPGAGHEFLERKDGFRGLVEAYRLEFAAPPRGIELGLVYQALVEGEVDIVSGNSTDGLIEKYDLVVLEDDRRYFPPYDAAAVYRPETVVAHGALGEVLALLEGSIDDQAMRRLNRLVDDDRRRAPDVVEEFVRDRGWASE
ncbi:MAG TPA: glycine betaine ABC transporter substrate-binding protein [Vicinamibacteria bacterium]|nr:glycine betaine ABC transporter substrate-binding protein [Vicinamibacteria bacterium]